MARAESDCALLDYYSHVGPVRAGNFEIAVGRKGESGSESGFDGKQGFGGACFPKDVSALTKYSKRFTLLEKCVTINNEYRKEYDKDDREILQNIKYD